MRILIVAPAWIGDMVMTDTLVQNLRRRHHDAEIHLLAPSATRSVAERLEGVQAVHELKAGHGELALGERWRFANMLCALRFDWAIVLPNSLKSALIPWFAGIPRRTGWLGEQRRGLLNDWRRLDEAVLPLQIERFMALGIEATESLTRPYPEPRLRADKNAALQVATALKLNLDAPITVLCPGAEYGPAKRWPSEHYAVVARHVIEGGGEAWLMGGHKDVDVCNEIVAQVGKAGVQVLAGKTRLGEAIDLMSLATRVICNDSGLMHVAAALGVPVTAIYGSTSPDFTPPLSPQAKVVRLGLSCSPCFKRECPLGHLNCLRTLTPDRVIAVSEAAA